MSVKARVSRRGARDQTYGALENTGVFEGLRLNIRNLHAGGSRSRHQEKDGEKNFRAHGASVSFADEFVVRSSKFEVRS